MFSEKLKQKNRPFPINVGYIAIPNEVERDGYVQNCYRKERVSILVDQGGFMIHDCYVSKSCMKDIRFPKTFEKLGSPVVYLFDQNGTVPIIVAVVSTESETDLLDEGKFKLNKVFGDNRVQIIGDAKGGNLFINLEMFDEQDADVNLAISSKKNSRLNISVNGRTLINSKDEFSIKTDSFNVGEATEPLTLADSLIALMSDLIDEIGASTTSTMLGAQPLINAPQILAFKNRLDEVKSKVSKSS